MFVDKGFLDLSFCRQKLYRQKFDKKVLFSDIVWYIIWGFPSIRRELCVVRTSVPLCYAVLPAPSRELCVVRTTYCNTVLCCLPSLMARQSVNCHHVAKKLLGQDIAQLTKYILFVVRSLFVDKRPLICRFSTKINFREILKP